MGMAAATAGGNKNVKMQVNRANCDISLDVRPLCTPLVRSNCTRECARSLGANDLRWFSAAVAAGIRGLFDNYEGAGARYRPRALPNSFSSSLTGTPEEVEQGDGGG